MDRGVLRSVPVAGMNWISESWPETLDGGRYVLVAGGEVGEGGMGEVHLYEQRSMRRPVAVKRLRGGEWGAMAGLLNEARMLARVRSPYVVQAIDFVAQDERAYIMTVVVDGVTLQRVIQDTKMAGRKLASRTAMGYVVCTAKALAATHKAGVAHLDVKPGNVMACPDGSAMLLDFGIARLMTAATTLEESVAGTVTSATFSTLVGGGFRGTPAYASPEQLRGSPDLGPPSDVFSWAVMAVETLTGIRLEDRSEAKVAAALHGIPEDVAAVLRAALAERPERRVLGGEPLTMERVAELLEQAGETRRWGSVDIGVRSRGFVGREAEINEVAVRLAECAGVVTLVGPGGVGKSRLATEVGERLRARYADGVVRVALSGLRGEDAPVEDYVREAVSGKRGRKGPVAGLLAGRQVLLVLDNCELVREPVARLVGGIRSGKGCERVAILATSRRALEGVEQEIVEVRGLAARTDRGGLGPGVELLAEVLRRRQSPLAQSPGFERWLGAVCEAVDGLPLALEWCGALLAKCSVEVLLRRLGEAREIAGAGSGGSGSQHANLEALFRDSVEGLTPGQVWLLRAMTVFDGGFSMEGLEAVVGEARRCGVDMPEDAGDVFGGMMRLADASLVQFELRRMSRGVGTTVSGGGSEGVRMGDEIEDGDRARYRLLFVTRAFLRAKGAEQAAGALRPAHAAWAERRATELAGEGQWSAARVARAADDAENIVAAVQWGAAQGDATQRARAVRTAVAFHRFFYVRCRFGEGLGLMRTAAAGLEDVDRLTRARALRALGVFAREVGQVEEAERAWTRAAELLAAEGEAARGEWASVLCNLFIAVGDRASTPADWERVVAMAEEAVGRCPPEARVVGAQMRYNLGWALCGAERWADALPACRGALEVFAAEGMRDWEGYALGNLGDALLRLGRYDEAWPVVRRAMDLAMASDDEVGMVMVGMNAAALLAAAGRAAEAAALVGRCDAAVAAGVGAPPSVAGTRAEVVAMLEAKLGKEGAVRGTAVGRELTWEAAVGSLAR
jgi:non-specific serine/threonine protein kinase